MPGWPQTKTCMGFQKDGQSDIMPNNLVPVFCIPCDNRNRNGYTKIRYCGQWARFGYARRCVRCTWCCVRRCVWPVIGKRGSANGVCVRHVFGERGSTDVIWFVLGLVFGKRPRNCKETLHQIPLVGKPSFRSDGNTTFRSDGNTKDIWCQMARRKKSLVRLMRKIICCTLHIV